MPKTVPEPRDNDVDRALAVLESDAELPKEPTARGWVGEIHNGRPGPVSYRAFRRWRRATRRLQTRRNREIMDTVPVPCRGCGTLFNRTRTPLQQRCPDCIAKSKAAGGH